MKLFFDGGYRPLGGGMETAVVLRGEAFVVQGLGPGSSLEAEWLALLAAVRLARDRGVAAPILLGDALAALSQAQGTARCPVDMAQHLAMFRAVASGLPGLRLRHVRRTQNLAGIVLQRLHTR